ncbi:MAG: DMT family transporter, partial [Clostridiales bacterium]|nr:DMT family transporter [Clostridiales bacterium]
IMVSFNGQLGIYHSMFAMTFFVHVIAAIILLIYIPAVQHKKIKFTGVPAYVYTVGFLGVSIVAISSFCTQSIGATAVMSLSVIGQMICSAIFDHYGVFGVKKIPFKKEQIPAYILVFVGILLVING